MNEEPTPIRWSNLRKWIRKTRRLDDELYQTSPRGPRITRLLWSLAPVIRRPLFVVGAPRSGTTFLGDACGSLPEFSYHYEPPMTKAAARYLVDRRWTYGQASRYYKLTYWWLTRRNWNGDLRLAEKTPQNCFIIDFLTRAFPDAQFIHIIRDGRDAAVSYREKPWLRADASASGKRESGGYRMGPGARFWVEANRRDEFESTSDLHRCIWAWRRFTEAALGHADALSSSSYLEVRYESLVADPPSEGRRVLDFLGIEEESSRTLLAQRLCEAHGDSVGRYRGQLTGDELLQVEKEAGALLDRLGYEQDHPEPTS